MRAAVADSRVRLAACLAAAGRCDLSETPLRYDGARIRCVFYAAKCYWPGVTEAEVQCAADRAAREAATGSGGDSDVAYFGSILFPDDALVLCLFEASSRSAVRELSRRAGIPCERVMDSVWLERPRLERRSPCARPPA
jgi:hypothetical protein